MMLIMINFIGPIVTQLFQLLSLCFHFTYYAYTTVIVISITKVIITVNHYQHHTATVIKGCILLIIVILTSELSLIKIPNLKKENVRILCFTRWTMIVSLGYEPAYLQNSICKLLIETQTMHTMRQKTSTENGLFLYYNTSSVSISWKNI